MFVYLFPGWLMEAAVVQHFDPISEVLFVRALVLEFVVDSFPNGVVVHHTYSLLNLENTNPVPIRHKSLTLHHWFPEKRPHNHILKGTSTETQNPLCSSCCSICFLQYTHVFLLWVNGFNHLQFSAATAIIVLLLLKTLMTKTIMRRRFGKSG